MENRQKLRKYINLFIKKYHFDIHSRDTMWFKFRGGKAKIRQYLDLVRYEGGYKHIDLNVYNLNNSKVCNVVEIKDFEIQELEPLGIIKNIKSIDYYVLEEDGKEIKIPVGEVKN